MFIKIEKQLFNLYFKTKQRKDIHSYTKYIYKDMHSYTKYTYKDIRSYTKYTYKDIHSHTK